MVVMKRTIRTSINSNQFGVKYAENIEEENAQYVVEFS
jgi:hypothetical protein